MERYGYMCVLKQVGTQVDAAVLEASGSFCLVIVLVSANQEGHQSTSGEGFVVHGDSAVIARGPHPRVPLCRPDNGICEM